MGFRKKISMKLVNRYMIIFFNFSPTSSHEVDEDDNGQFRLQRVKPTFGERHVFAGI